jgi:hypothetical protein
LPELEKMAAAELAGVGEDGGRGERERVMYVRYY